MMNVFYKVTLRSLLKNRTRTVVSVIGIILSAAMICAVTTFTSSIYNYSLDNAIYTSGDWHGCAENADGETLSLIKKSEDVSKYVFAEQLGYARADESRNANKPYLFVLGASKHFEDTMPVHLTSGRYPASADEIIIPEHLLLNGGVSVSEGDVLELTLGKRTLDGEVLWQNTPYYVTYDENGTAIPSDETFVPEDVRIYTVVGVYERPSFEYYTSPGYTLITLAQGDNAGQYYSVWFKMEKAKSVYSFMKENGLSGDTNSSVLRHSGASVYSGFNSMLMGLSVIVTLLIVFGSVSLIYNAFSISVSERTKQFGLLSSVGATKKQLRRMVFYEAFTVSAVGIPVGILAGIGGIGVTLFFVGNKFKSLVGYPIPLRMSVSWESVAVAVVTALLTVLISALVPSFRATRITAIEAIRQNKDVNSKIKKERTSKITYFLFGLPGVLANRNYKRSRKKYRATVVSLFMSTVLFVTAAAFTGALTESVERSMGNVKYDVLVIVRDGSFENDGADELLSALKNDKGVESASYSKDYNCFTYVSPRSVTDRFFEYYTMGENICVNDTDRVEIYTDVKFVDDNTFRTLLKKHKLDSDKYYDSSSPCALIVDGRVLFDKSLGKYVDCNVLKNEKVELMLDSEKPIEGYFFDEQTMIDGESIFVYRSETTPDERLLLKKEEVIVTECIEIGDIIYDDPHFVDAEARITAIYPICMLDEVASYYSFGEYEYYLTSSDHTETVKSAENTLTALGLETGRVYDIAETAEEGRNIVVIVQVFSYGFITLITLIAVANVFNTVSTNIGLRRRELAMLKSVGLTSGGFNRMMAFECLLYGSRALLFGLPVSIVMSKLVHVAMSEGYSTAFVPPWRAVIIAVFSVFLVVFISMMYSMHKIKKEDPISALKNENL